MKEHAIQFDSLPDIGIFERRGKELKTSEVRRLERLVQEDQSDIKSRLLLVSYYRRAPKHQESLARHAVWLIENFPESPIHEEMDFYESGKVSQMIKKQWAKTVRLNPCKLKILRNAAHACIILAPSAAIRYMKMAQAIEPEEEEWARELSQFYSYGACDPLLAADRLSARRAIQSGKRALKLHQEYPKNSYLETCMMTVVSELSNLALKFAMPDAARYFGKYLLNRHGNKAKLHVGEAGGRNKVKNEMHLGHSILGRAALAEGKLSVAKEHLAKMTEFGNPDWQQDLVLARELLSKGERDAVLAYLEGCAENLQDRLDQFVKTPVDPSQMLKLMLMFSKDPHTLTDLSGSLQFYIAANLAQIEQWCELIRQKRRPKLPDSLGYL